MLHLILFLLAAFGSPISHQADLGTRAPVRAPAPPVTVKPADTGGINPI
jgi:hypothetical protein